MLKITIHSPSYRTRLQTISLTAVVPFEIGGTQNFERMRRPIGNDVLKVYAKRLGFLIAPTGIIRLSCTFSAEHDMAPGLTYRRKDHLISLRWRSVGVRRDEELEGTRWVSVLAT